MKLESIIRRENGTVVKMDAPTKTYHFKPEQPDGPHFAEVDIEHHARAMLRIKEGYRLAEGETLPPEIVEELEPVKLNGSVVHNASYTIHGETFTLEELVQVACDDSGLTPEEWNELPDQSRYAYIDASLKELQDGTQGDTLQPGDFAADDADDADQTDANDAGQPEEESHEDEAEATQDESADEGDQQSDDTQEAAERTQEEGEQQGAEEAPLNTLPKRELMALFEKKVGVKPSAKLTIADLVAGIEGADD